MNRLVRSIGSWVEIVRALRTTPAATPDVPPPPPPRPSTPDLRDLVAELACCLWYVETKHLGVAWASERGRDALDARQRRLLARVRRTVRALERSGFTVRDPTGERYAPGAEKHMKPVDFQTRDGLDDERVSEAMSPVVLWREAVIRRAEVFVEVPPQPTGADDQPLQPQAKETSK